MIDPESFMVAMPEIMLAAFALIQTVVVAIIPNRTARSYGMLSIFGLCVAGFLLYNVDRLHFNMNGAISIFAFDRTFDDDGFARFVKMILLAGSALSIMLSWTYVEDEKLAAPEYPVLILFATVGMMLMVSAHDFLVLYVGLELQSLALYVLAAFRRDNAKSSEAGLKYFVLGALSSGIILYGISLIYGFTGSTEFLHVFFSLHDAPTLNALGVTFGLVFICAALAFKVSAVPFHMWTPDVYEGAPTPVTAFFAAAPKVAALALLTRVLYEPFSPLVDQWNQIIVFAAIASMLLGSFAGLVQPNLKRLMAYSSIANVGFALVAIATHSIAGIQALLIYLSIYFLNTLGIFAVLMCLRRDGKMVERTGDLSGLAKTNPLVALAMVFFMFSIAGVPPLAGFFGKYFIFLAAVKAGMVPLAVIGMLTSVVSAFYYLRIVKVMYFDEPLEPIDPLPDFGVKLVLGASAIYMLAFTLYPSFIIDQALSATQSFLGVSK